MRPFPLHPLARAVALATVLLAACTSGNEAITTDSSLPTTTAAAGSQSGAPEPVATIDPATASTIVQPEATTTTSTTTTTTTTIAVLPEGRAIDPVFDPILDDLVAGSGIPVRLPVDAGLGEDTGIVASLYQADEDGYVIYLGFEPDCNGGNVCRVASFTGRRLVDGDSLDDELGLSVPLPGGLEGRFFDATCGANCGDGWVTWVEDGIRYSVGEKFGQGPAMMDLAWQSIDPTAALPERPDACGTETVRDDGRVAVVKSDEDAGLHWLTLCSQDGLRLALVNGPGRLSWFDFDENGEKDLALTLDEDGSTMLISLSGIEAMMVTDFDTFDRLRVGDIHCMDLTGDGRREIIDGTDGSVFEFLNPISVARADATVDNVDSFDRCF